MIVSIFYIRDNNLLSNKLNSRAINFKYCPLVKLYWATDKLCLWNFIFLFLSTIFHYFLLFFDHQEIVLTYFKILFELYRVMKEEYCDPLELLILSLFFSMDLNQLLRYSLKCLIWIRPLWFIMIDLFISKNLIVFELANEK